MLTSQAPRDRASSARYREHQRTAWYGPTEPVPPKDPFERWLQEVEDACFAAGCQHERDQRRYNRPHWRLWDYAQRMAWRHAPYSRLRFLLEPEDEEQEIGYREKWKNHYPDQPLWDFFLRLLWLYARNSRIRRWVAPDGPQTDK